MAKNTEAPPTWKQRKASIKRKWTIPFQRIEWACEWLSYHMSQWAFIDVLEYGGKLAVVVTAGIYLFSWQQRKEAGEDARKTKHYVAWQTLNSAQGKSGDAGRTLALVDLAKDNVSLDGIDLSGVTLGTNAILRNAEFSDANLRGLVVESGDFGGAWFWKAKMDEARLLRCNFANAILFSASLTNAFLKLSTFSKAELLGAKCFGADFTFADLTGASLREANVEGATFNYALLRNANLKDMEGWKNAKWQRANVFGVAGAPSGFIEWATNHGAVVIPVNSYREWETQAIPP